MLFAGHRNQDTFFVSYGGTISRADGQKVSQKKTGKERTDIPEKSRGYSRNLNRNRPHGLSARLEHRLVKAWPRL